MSMRRSTSDNNSIGPTKCFRVKLIEALSLGNEELRRAELERLLRAFDHTTANW
jgi:hypothetical protein